MGGLRSFNEPVRTASRLERRSRSRRGPNCLKNLVRSWQDADLIHVRVVLEDLLLAHLALEHGLRGNDTVAKPPWLPHETRGLSDGHVDGVEATWDAIAAILKSSSSFLTLSQRLQLAQLRVHFGQFRLGLLELFRGFVERGFS